MKNALPSIQTPTCNKSSDRFTLLVYFSSPCVFLFFLLASFVYSPAAGAARMLAPFVQLNSLTTRHNRHWRQSWWLEKLAFLSIYTFRSVFFFNFTCLFISQKFLKREQKMPESSEMPLPHMIVSFFFRYFLHFFPYLQYFLRSQKTSQIDVKSKKKIVLEACYNRKKKLFSRFYHFNSIGNENQKDKWDFNNFLQLVTSFVNFAIFPSMTHYS